MKKFGPSQYGLLLLATMVFSRAFFGGDYPLVELFSTSEPAAVSFTSSHIDESLVYHLTANESTIKYAQVAPNSSEFDLVASTQNIQDANEDIADHGGSSERPMEFQLFRPTFNSGSNLSETLEESEDAEDIASIDVEEESYGLSDSESSLPMALQLFKPTFSDHSYQDESKEDEVAPLDGGSSSFRSGLDLFPVSH